MTIQGIIIGYADPDKKESNLVLVGRGSKYLIVENGQAQEAYWTDLDEAYWCFYQKMDEDPARLQWREVTEIATGLDGSIVTGLSRTYTYADKKK